MKNGDALTHYQKTNIETSGKLELVIMCYEKAILFLHDAKHYFQEQQFEKKAKNLKRVLDIIYELRASLNFEKGDEIAANLAAIYGYLIRRLQDGDIKKDLSAFDETIEILSELKEAWENIAPGKENHANNTIIPAVPARIDPRVAA
ncbi:flagellar export chaperone FliS [Thermodesulfobacteriota bacterium]